MKISSEGPSNPIICIKSGDLKRVARNYDWKLDCQDADGNQYNYVTIVDTDKNEIIYACPDESGLSKETKYVTANPAYLRIELIAGDNDVAVYDSSDPSIMDEFKKHLVVIEQKDRMAYLDTAEYFYYEN